MQGEKILKYLFGKKKKVSPQPMTQPWPATVRLGQLSSKYRSTADLKLHREGNVFQMGIEAVREMMQYQIGLGFTSNTAALTGEWRTEDGEFYDARYTIEGVSRTDRCIVHGRGTDDGVVFEFPSVMFLDMRTQVNWNPLPQALREKWMRELKGDRHKNSINRAKEIMNLYIHKRMGRRRHTDIIVTLDGNGENRYGMKSALREQNIKETDWPSIYTFEMNPDVALASQIMFGKENIKFTGSDPEFHSKTLLGKGGVMLEHLIQKQNNVYTDDMKRRTKFVYFDYCGGPAGNQAAEACRKNFEENILPQLPNLEIIAMTISHRQHPGLKENGIREYISLPSSFVKKQSFTENHRVLCEVFERETDERGTEQGSEQELKAMKRRFATLEEELKRSRADAEEQRLEVKRLRAHLEKVMEPLDTDPTHADPTDAANVEAEPRVSVEPRQPYVSQGCLIIAKGQIFKKTYEELLSAATLQEITLPNLPPLISSPSGFRYVYSRTNGCWFAQYKGRFGPFADRRVAAIAVKMIKDNRQQEFMTFIENLNPSSQVSTKERAAN